ncbi:MAG: O-antigen ligase family protein [Phycicoccus sp.]|nr:O-antigen ligase family protein [Phycicoccus sp.]
MLESSWILVACGYALITGYAARGTRWAPALSSVLLALVLMFVTVRATSDAMFGLRPTSLVVGGLGILGTAWAVGQGGLNRRLLVPASLGVVVLLVSFRAGATDDLATSALTLALPAFCLGLTSGRASVEAMRRTTILLGIVLLGLLLVQGSLLSGRLLLPQENPIWIGRGLCFAALCVLAGRGAMGRRTVLAAPLIAGAYLTGSRGPLVGLAMGILVLAAARLHGRARVVFPLGLLTTIVLVVANGSVVDTVSFGIDRTESVSSRYDIWADYLRLWLQSPVLGTGMSSELSSPSGSPSPHSFIVELLAQGGILALTAFVALLMLAWRPGPGRSDTVQALVAATIVMALLSGSLWINLELWLLAGWAATVRPQPASGVANTTVDTTSPPTRRQAPRRRSVAPAGRTGGA